MFKEEILAIDKNLRIRFNYPYLGISDGFTSYLRKKFNQKNYVGIELEVNQKFLSDNIKWEVVKDIISRTLVVLAGGILKTPNSTIQITNKIQLQNSKFRTG